MIHNMQNLITNKGFEKKRDAYMGRLYKFISLLHKDLENISVSQLLCLYVYSERILSIFIFSGAMFPLHSAIKQNIV